MSSFSIGRIGIGCLLMAGIFSFASAQEVQTTSSEYFPPPTQQELSKWHEVFTYEIKYSFFKLGEVKVEVVSDTVYQGREGRYLRSIITSNPGIPFVGTEENHYNSIYMKTDSIPLELVYWRDNVDEGEYNDVRFEYNFDKGEVYGRVDEIGSDTLEWEPGGNSGHLSFITNRLFAGTDTTYRMPVYIDLEKGYLKLENTTQTEMREYEAFDKPVKAYLLNGETTIEGPFGFKGSFESWYLADALRVPLEARVKVWLGNVKIRLIDYKKKLRE